MFPVRTFAEVFTLSKFHAVHDKIRWRARATRVPSAQPFRFHLSQLSMLDCLPPTHVNEKAQQPKYMLASDVPSRPQKSKHLSKIQVLSPPGPGQGCAGGQ